MIVVQRDADLAEVIETLRRARRLTRAACTAGNNNAASRPMIPITIISSIIVKPDLEPTGASFHRYCPRGFPIAPDRGQHPLGSHGSWGAPINCVDLAK